VIVSGKMVAERLSTVSSNEAKSYPPHV